MPQSTNDNFALKAPRCLDDRSTKIVSGASVPYATTSEALAAVSTSYRHRGLSMFVDTGSGLIEYWFKADITNGDLVVKNTQTQADWTQATTSDPSYILHKPTLATVATSGLYSDLSSKPVFGNGFTVSGVNVTLGGPLTTSVLFTNSGGSFTVGNDSTGNYILELTPIYSKLGVCINSSTDREYIQIQSHLIRFSLNNIDCYQFAPNSVLFKSSSDVAFLTLSPTSSTFACLIGTGDRVVLADASGVITATSTVVENFVTDSDIITAITGATYNGGNNYKSAISPASAKIFAQGQHYESGAYMYFAVADNVVRRFAGG